MDIASATTFLAQTARSSGLEFQPDALAAAAAQLAETVERDATTGAFAYQSDAGAAFRIEAGQLIKIPVQDHVVGIIRENTKPVAPPAPPAPAPETPGTPAPTAKSSAPEWARRSSGLFADFARTWAATEDAKTAKEIATWANPWIAGPNYNRTRQTIITNRDPGLAARFKAQAGV